MPHKCGTVPFSFMMSLESEVNVLMLNLLYSIIDIIKYIVDVNWSIAGVLAHII